MIRRSVPVQDALDHSCTQARDSLDAALTSLSEWLDKADPKDQVSVTRDEILTQIDKVCDDTRHVIAAVLNALKQLGDLAWDSAVDKIEAQIQGTQPGQEGALVRFQAELKDAVAREADAAENAVQLLQRAKEQIQKLAANYVREIQGSLEQLHSESSALVADAKKQFEDINQGINDVWTDVERVVADIRQQITDVLNVGIQLERVRQTLDEKWKSIEQLLVGDLKTPGVLWKLLYKTPDDQPDSVFGILFLLDKELKALSQIVIQDLVQWFGNFDQQRIKDWLNTLAPYQRLANALVREDREAILQESAALAKSVNQEFGRLAGNVAQLAREARAAVASGSDLVQTGKQTLNNYRSVWEQFTAPGMGLNRHTVAMLVNTDWKDVEHRLSLTPCISRVKQFGKDLEGLGLRLPVVSLTDRLLPPMPNWNDVGKSMLDKFGFGNLLSDIGGMRLDKLFPGFKMPQFARDKIRITQGFDKKNLMAWVDAHRGHQLSRQKTADEFRSPSGGFGEWRLHRPFARGDRCQRKNKEN